MNIDTLLHAAVLVTNLERSRAFYEGVLGLKEKPRHNFDFPGAWYDLGRTELHLIVTTESLPEPTSRPRRDYHVAFQVSDLAEARRAVQAAGVNYRESSSGLPSIFVRDPDGNLIELQQR
jgi:glyoxylase I family protein